MSVEGVASVGAKTGFKIIAPTFWITLVIFSVLLIYGSVLAFEEHSIFPVFDKALFKIGGAEGHIGYLLDEFESSSSFSRPNHWYQILVSKWLWSYVLFFSEILSDLFFIWFWFVLWFVIIRAFYNASDVVNVIIAGLIAYLLMWNFNGVIYQASLAGHTLSDDKLSVMSDQFFHTIPGSNVVRLFVHVFNKELFIKAGSFIENNVLVKELSDIPDSVNVTGDV